jgi:hypothetical protein
MAGIGSESHEAVLVERFLHDLHTQLQSQENLRDFLLWWGGSLEYWIHIAATTVGSRHGNVIRSEIPYRTRSRPKGAKPAQEELWTKWADGAVLLEGEVGVLIEGEMRSLSEGHRNAALRRRAI